MEMREVNDNSEGHMFNEGDKLNVEAENATMTIKRRLVQVKNGEKHLGYWVSVDKLDGSFSGIRTVNELWIKDLPLIS